MEETKFTRWRYMSKVFQKRFWFHVRDDLDDCFSYSCKERISRKSSSRRSTHKASEYKINWIQEPRVWFYITLKYISPNFSYFYFLFSFFSFFFFHIFFHIFFFFFLIFFSSFTQENEILCVCIYSLSNKSLEKISLTFTTKDDWHFKSVVVLGKKIFVNYEIYS